MTSIVSADTIFNATRRSRLEWVIGSSPAVSFHSDRDVSTATSIIGLTSSRLGRDVTLHRHVCQFLSRSLLDASDRGAAVLIADGSAIAPWAIRAAELFGVPAIHLRVGDDVWRDAAVIAIADRVDAVYVRSGGTIATWLDRRTMTLADASTRVAIYGRGHCAAAELIGAGAIGWYQRLTPISPTPISPPGQNAGATSDEPWMRTDGRWLVHCTRRRDGPWPGESMDQYLDAMLVDHPHATRRAPIDALERIVASRRLIASSVATAKSHPVVCFSAVPLAELLDRRCFRPQLGRWDYEPFGVAIRLSAAKTAGLRPVIYGDGDRRKQLAPSDRYRFHSIGKTFDWRTEREWRSSQSLDLDAFDRSDVRLFAVDSPDARAKLKRSPWPITWLS